MAGWYASFAAYSQTVHLIKEITEIQHEGAPLDATPR